MDVKVDSLVPHQPPMRWVDSLIVCDDITARARVLFTADHFAVTDGFVPETALVESMAQAVAAAMGYRKQAASEKGPPAAGMLVAVSSFRIHCPPRVGEMLEIEVRDLKRLGPMVVVSGTITCAGQGRASGELTLYA